MAHSDRVGCKGPTPSAVAVPEPASYAMLALGLAGIGAAARRARHEQA